jgi:hypothetical protein
MRLERTRHRNRSAADNSDLNISDSMNRQSVIQLDNSELNEEEENDLKKLAI